MSENKKILEHTIGEHATFIKLPIQAGWDKSLVVATLSLEIYHPTLIKEDLKNLCEKGCQVLVKRI